MNPGFLAHQDPLRPSQRKAPRLLRSLRCEGDSTQEQPVNNNRAEPSLWSRKRPRGAQVTVNDNIAALQQIFGVSEFPPNFTFLGSDDGPTEEDDAIDELPINTSIIRQPESRPMSQSQLATEVKGIYSKLVVVEQKCVGAVNVQSQSMQQTLDRAPSSRKSQVEQFPALIALHRTLLNEHHDFLLASQHPSAGRNIKELATKYSMAARMWKHGIHNFLELLRHCLPQSLDHMLVFIDLAYQMMALLFETVPSFGDTWIECLGDLARYRMAIEDEDLRDREVWTRVAKSWYVRATDTMCDTGRLFRECISGHELLALLNNTLCRSPRHTR